MGTAANPQQNNQKKYSGTEPIKELVRACIQCGTCSASCPNVTFMDLTPRALWRRVLADRFTEILDSRTFIVCSACYTCTLRCPRGIEVTRAMSMLKALSLKDDTPVHRRSTRFYENFMESVRRHGRVREGEFMTLYFLAMKNPLLPFSFASLGIKLMAKGKLKMELPSGGGKGALDSLFKKAAELEETP